MTTRFAQAIAAIERTVTADVCACEDCAGIRGAPDAAAGIAGAAWLDAMQADEAMAANESKREKTRSSESGTGKHEARARSSRNWARFRQHAVASL